MNKKNILLIMLAIAVISGMLVSCSDSSSSASSKVNQNQTQTANVKYLPKGWQVEKPKDRFYYFDSTDSGTLYWKSEGCLNIIKKYKYTDKDGKEATYYEEAVYRTKNSNNSKFFYDAKKYIDNNVEHAYITENYFLKNVNIQGYTGNGKPPKTSEEILETAVNTFSGILDVSADTIKVNKYGDFTEFKFDIYRLPLKNGEQTSALAGIPEWYSYEDQDDVKWYNGFDWKPEYVYIDW